MFYWGDYLAMGIVWTVAWFLMGILYAIMKDRDGF